MPVLSTVGTRDPQPRYLRLLSTDFVLLTSTGTSLGPLVVWDHVPTVPGAPWKAVASSSASFVLLASPRLPFGAVLDKLWAITSTPGTETTTDSLFMNVQDPGSQLHDINANIAHTNGAAALSSALDVSAVSVDQYYDVGGADPSAITALPSYNVIYSWGYDATAGGSQTCYFYGCLLRYHYPDNTLFLEPT